MQQNPEVLADRLLARLRPLLIELIRSEQDEPDPLSDLTPKERDRVERKASRMIRR